MNGQERIKKQEGSQKNEFINESIEEKETRLEEMIVRFEVLKKELDDKEPIIDKKIAELEEKLRKLTEGTKEEIEPEFIPKSKIISSPETENIKEKELKPEATPEPIVESIEEVGNIRLKENKKNSFKKFINNLSINIGLKLSSLNDKVFEIGKGQKNLSKTQKMGEAISSGINKLYGNKGKEEKNGVEEKNADVELDKVINDISEEDKEILVKEMRKSISLEFEPKEIKRDYKLFIKNQMVKMFSGFKISENVKKVILKPTKKLLLTTAVLSLWTSSGSFVKPENVDGEISTLKNKEIIDDVSTKIIETGDLETYNQLSENGKRVYLYSLSKIKDTYIIVDKVNATLYIIGSDKKIVCSMPVLLGQMKGETPNMADPESDIASGATTPAGKYTLSRIPNEDGLITYKGKVFNIVGGKGLSLHITYPKEIEERSKALRTQTVDDNRMSWGCINVSEEMWDKYIEKNISCRGTTIFILPDVLPDNTMAYFNPETGETEKGIENDHNLLAMGNQLQKAESEI